MSDIAVNRVIDRLTSDGAFLLQVRSARESALQDFDLGADERNEILQALDREEECLDFAALRTVARFGPLFAAASASSTKVG